MVSEAKTFKGSLQTLPCGAVTDAQAAVVAGVTGQEGHQRMTVSKKRRREAFRLLKSNPKTAL